MKVKLKRIPPLAAAKMTALFYGCISLIFIPFMLIATIAGIASGEQNAGTATGMGVAMVIVLPVFYVVGGFVFTLLGCWIYNLIASWIGGVELEFDEMDTEV